MPANIPKVKWAFPNTVEPFLWYIQDRRRNSGLTSVRFLPDNRVVCCDYNEKRMYLVDIDINERKLNFLDSCPTVINTGEAVQTDLMDVKDDLIVVTNFYQGSVSFYQICNGKLVFSRELNTNDFVNVHGVRFVPGYDNLLWVTYCGKNNKCWELVDYKKNEVVRRMMMDEQMQDVAFIGQYVLACARTNHITPHGRSPCKMYATVYLYRMPENLYEAEPELLDTWHGEGHLDAMIEYEGKAYAANQYTDAVDVFSIRNEKIHKELSIGGFAMPHGIDIRDDGVMAVTNYVDNSLRVMSIK